MIKKYKVLLSLCTLITTFYSTQPLTELQTEQSVFINTTEETVVLKTAVGTTDKYAIIPPRNSAYFTVLDRPLFWAPHILVDQRGNKIPYNGGLDLVTKKPDPNNPKREIGSIEENNQKLFFKEIELKRIHLRNYSMQANQLPKTIFEKIVKAAEKYSSGVDNAICQALDEIKTLSNTDIPELDPNIDFKSLLSNTAPKAGSKLPAKAPVNCTFGLAKIVKAIPRRTSLEKHPVYIIQYTAGKNDSEVMEFELDKKTPKLQLITN